MGQTAPNAFPRLLGSAAPIRRKATEPPTTNPLAVTTALLLAFSLVLLALAAHGPGTAPAAPHLFGAAVAVLLDARAVSLGGASFFSAAPAVLLALLCLGQVRLALFAGLVGVVLRCLLQDRTGRGSARDLLCLTLAGLAARFNPHPALVLDAYLFAWLVFEATGPSHTRTLRARMRLLFLGQLLFAVVWMQLNGVALLAAAPALWCFQYAAHRSLEGYRAEEREDLRAHLQRSGEQIEQEREERARLERFLQARVAESTWQSEVARELSRAADFPAWSERLFRLLRSVAWLRSTALFRVESDGRWCLLGHRSPDAAALEAAALLEPGPPQLAQEPHSETFSLDAETRLYVGTDGQGWSEQQRNLLGLVATCAAESWPALQKLERLSQEAGSARKLEQQVDVLQQLLTSARSLASRLDADQVVQQLLAASQSYPGQSRSLCWWRDDAPHPAAGLAAQPELVAQVARSARPLLLDDVGGSRFSPLEPRERSLLAVPLSTEEEVVGVLVLGAPSRGAFTREHQDRLQLLGMLAAQALRNSQLHEQVVEALRRQRESEAQLIQSSKMAAVGQLAAGVAHELNTPLGTVVLSLDALQYKLGDNPLAQTAAAAAEQARSIIAKLLYYSRDARTGLRTSDLNGILRDTLQLIGQQLKLDQVEVRLQLEELPPLSLNQNEIQQVLTNLLLNARDALGSERWIEVTTCRENDQVVLRVQDPGAGIPADVAERVFEPFFTTKPVGKGTGLGLSVSQQILQAHGGELVLESLAHPTCVAVRLPVKGAPDAV